MPPSEEHGLLSPQLPRVLLVLPTHNNAGTLEHVVNSACRYMDHVLVVNDGSTDATAEILTRVPNKVTVLTHPQNQGKGAALLTAFRYAKAKQFDVVVTMDTDGQHFAEDLPRFVEMCRAHPGDIIIGDRNLLTHPPANTPGSSVFGCKFSNFWVWLETGRRLTDTQSGFRAYPVKKLPLEKLAHRAYDFEIEILVKALWSGVGAHCLPVAIHYPPRAERVSHFKPWLDNVRLSVLHTKLVLSRAVQGVLAVLTLGRFAEKKS